MVLHSSTASHPQTIGTSVYRPRRPARSVLHKTVRHHLETWLAGHDHTEESIGDVPAYVEVAFRAYLKCGILAHRFARVHCGGCGHQLLVAFVHRFGSFLNSHVHYHVLVTDGVFSPTDNDDATFHAAIDFTQQDIVDVQSRMRARGLRFLERHGHLDRTAIDSLDAAEHAGGWSVDASVRIAEWDRQGLKRLVRYCARPPLSADRLEQLNESTLVYRLRKPTLDGHTELILKPLELLERLSKLITPPRIHKHRYCGVLAPNARLRRAVIASAGPAGATRQLLEQATDKMQLPDAENRAVASSTDAESPSDPPSAWHRTAAHCWALLLIRIYECLPLICPRCGEAMRIVAFIQEPPMIERILHHIGEPTEAPQVLPARAPPQQALEFDNSTDVDEWPDVDQTTGDFDDFVE